MPVKQVKENGRTGYKWGNTGTTYFGPGARAKAQQQAKAIYASGYKKEKK